MYTIVANKRPGLGKQEAIAVYGSSAMTTPTFYRVMHNTVVDWYRANNHPVFEIGTGTGAPDNVISGNLLQNDSTIQDTTLMENDSGAQTLFDLASNVYYCTQPASEWFRRDGSTLLSFTQWTNWADETAGRQLQVALRDPTRSAASYNYARGGEATLEAYLDECRQQSQAAWRDDYTALALIRYIHEGFRPTVDLGPTQVGAVWPPDTSAMYELIARAEGPGRIDPDPNGFYVQGATVSVQAVSLGPPEWFAGWTGDRTGTDNPLIVRLTSNVTVTAVFVPEPGLVAWAVVALGLLRRGGQKTRE